MTSILNPTLKTTNDSYQQMNGILTQTGDTLAIPRNEPGNKHAIQEILVQEEPINNNNLENEVNVPSRIVSDREQPNPIFVNRNQNADEVLANMQRNQMLQGQNGPNRGFKLKAIQNP